ncbi:phospho-acceptor domain-containing protein [Deinococcus yavapaiensis KR-236]|uniref:histidine kinase n=2 Tax=Deinococcus TaxID=1298 RepID=A0A318SPY0_9DEIO|nr:phospho-acceptor domain-containing protein [Deinococcus yavapaiensis KR-236]
MAASSSCTHVFVAVNDVSLHTELSMALPEARVLHAESAEGLLRDTRSFVPDVVLLSADLPSGVALTDVFAMLRSRAEHVHTRWIVMGQRNLGAFLQGGADALIAPGTPAVAVATLLKTHLTRVRQLREVEERAHTQQARLDAWAHEERVRDQLVHMLVHDLKNPISAILGLLDVVLEDGKRVPADLLDLLRLSREECQHLLHLAVNMLDVRKIQAGKMRLNFTTLFAPKMADVLSLAQGDVGVGLAERKLILDLPTAASPLHADPEILRRIFANLLSNAVKHTTRGGAIVISARESNGQMQWCVQDDGEGIPAEDIPNLFSAFEQSRLTLHSRFDTGMGLAFCKLAVEGHGGRIWVESERGLGSRFYFTLPFIQEEEDDFVEVLSN